MLILLGHSNMSEWELRSSDCWRMILSAPVPFLIFNFLSRETFCLWVSPVVQCPQRTEVGESFFKVGNIRGWGCTSVGPGFNPQMGEVGYYYIPKLVSEWCSASASPPKYCLDWVLGLQGMGHQIHNFKCWLVWIRIYIRSYLIWWTEDILKYHKLLPKASTV